MSSSGYTVGQRGHAHTPSWLDGGGGAMTRLTDYSKLAE